VTELTDLPNDEPKLDTERVPGRLTLDPLPDGAPGRGEDPVAGARAAVAARKAGVPLAANLKVLYLRRWTAIMAFLLVVGTVTVYTFTATSIYEARIRLLMEADDKNVVSFQQVVEEGQRLQDYYQTQYNILQSRTLARRTMDALKLWDRPPFGGPPAKRGALDVVKDGLKAGAGAVAALFGAEDPSATAADETAAQSRAIDAFLANLTVTPVRNSRLVDVKYRLPDAQLATTIVNAIAKNYIDQSLEYKFLASKEATDWLDVQLAEQRTQVQNSEIALQRYREQNDAISFADRENIVVQKLADLNAAVTRARIVRSEKESIYNQLQSSRSDSALLDTFPAILANTFIQGLKTELADLQRQRSTLRETLLDNHPRMIDLASSIKTTQTKLDAEVQKVVMSVKSELDAAVAQERSLVQALDQQKGEALGMNQKYIEYSVLDRESESSKQLYDSLMQRAKETGVSGELRTSSISVVDPAERPRRPVTPQRGLNMLLGLVGGIFFAVGLVFFFEYLDSHIKTPEDIKTHLGLPSLGMLPITGDQGKNAPYPLLGTTASPQFVEAFSTLRTNILFSTAQEGARSVVVTSTGPGEGKSVVASNLAISLAQAGMRTLLIDADMRRPKAHTIFGISQQPGLSDLLTGQASASQTVQKSSVSELWVLTSGRTPPNPSELLGSARFKNFMNSLKAHFDWIIVDSPPVMAVTDASLVANVASGVLFVVGAEMTSRHVAQESLDRLEQAHAKFVGAVLNRVDLARHPLYYSQYYRKEYAQYYVKQL